MPSGREGAVKTALWLRLVLAACLLLALGGVGRGWLPAAILFAGALAAAFIAERAVPAVRRTGLVGFVREWAFPLALGAAVALVLATRLPAALADLGHVPLDIDEHRLAANVKLFFTTGELGHETVEHYPGIVFWLLTASSLAGYVQILLRGVAVPIGDVPLETFVAAGRLANIAVAGGIVAMTGLIGRRLAGPWAGILAAVVAALTPLLGPAVLAMRNDPGMTLVVLGAVHASLVAHRSGSRSWFVAAGALAGLAAAIKYSAVFALAPALVAACAGGPWRRRLQGAAVAGAAFAVALGVTNHFLWADFPNLMRQLSDQVAITGRSHWAATDNPRWFYVHTLGTLGPGWVMTALAAAAAAYALATRDAARWIVCLFPVLYLWVMPGRPSQLARWVYPLAPFVAVAGAAAAVALARWVRGALPGTAGPALRACAVAAVTAAALVQPLWMQAEEFSRRLVRPTWAEAEAWLQQHVPPGQVVLIEQDWLRLPAGRLSVMRVPDLGAQLKAGIEPLRADVVVVPRADFGRRGLERLTLVARVRAVRGFGGAAGPDFDIYTVPPGM